MQIIHQVTSATNLPSWKVENTIKLLDEGGTIPFIARYRKEATGSLDEVEISAINKEYKRLIELVKRKEFILGVIDEQGKLTTELKKKIEQCWSTIELEDIYLPYKPKRKTRATKARDAGLEPFAELIMKQYEEKPKQKASRYICTDYPDQESVLNGAKDIIAEWINENAAARNAIRYLFERKSSIYAKLIKGKEEAGKKYRDYFNFDEPLHKCPSHRLLAIRRGESEGILRVSIKPEKEMALEKLCRLIVRSRNESGQIVEEAVEESYKRLLAPSIETEFKNSSKERADLEAIDVFTKNLRQLLLAAPLGQKRVLAIDPGFRSGCKVVCLDEQGKFLKYENIFPHPPQNYLQQSEEVIGNLIKKYKSEVIAIGNGTAGRETERWIKKLVRDQVEIYLISEDGASIYSASEVARDEFPNLDLTVRGAISIGRRLLDPLAELVKIDAKSIGVGQYQHDVDQTLLNNSLDEVVTSCVNNVGVNINTASAQLLSYVSGLGKKGGENIVQFRDEYGPFKKRVQLKKVKGIGPKAFEQSAGFLRIPNAKNPLDNSGVHPERYSLVEKIALDINSKIESLVGELKLIDSINLQKYVSNEVGLPTLKDIIQELKKPGLDPRGEAIAFSFADHIRTIDDLNIGMVIPGKITNVTKFGAFVDIGIKENGLIHISQMADKYISDPSEVVSLDQIVEVKIISIDKDRGRINLSMKN